MLKFTVRGRSLLLKDILSKDAYYIFDNLNMQEFSGYDFTPNEKLKAGCFGSPESKAFSIGVGLGIGKRISFDLAIDDGTTTFDSMMVQIDVACNKLTGIVSEHSAVPIDIDEVKKYALLSVKSKLEKTFGTDGYIDGINIRGSRKDLEITFMPPYLSENDLKYISDHSVYFAVGTTIL